MRTASDDGKARGVRAQKSLIRRSGPKVCRWRNSGLLPLEEREAGTLVLDHLVAIGKVIDSAVLDFFGEKEQAGDFTTLVLLLAQMEIIRFSRFLGDYTVSHDG